MSTTRVHYNIKVEGNVQGVFYRSNTEEKARELGLTGFVRNEPDGSVYLEVEGDQPAVDNMIEWCHEGPQGARVKEVHYAPEKYIHGYKNFIIER